MGMPITAPRYTVHDLDAFPHDGNRYELLDGMLLVTPAPATVHQLVCGHLYGHLWTVVMRTGDAWVTSPGVVRVPPTLHLEPDILVYPSRFKRGTVWDDITEHWLAIEVLSPSSRMYDREFKRDAYLAVGVAEMWLVDAVARTVEISRRGTSETVNDTLRWRVPGIDRIVAIDLNEVFGQPE